MIRVGSPCKKTQDRSAAKKNGAAPKTNLSLSAFLPKSSSRLHRLSNSSPWRTNGRQLEICTSPFLRDPTKRTAQTANWYNPNINCKFCWPPRSPTEKGEFWWNFVGWLRFPSTLQHLKGTHQTPHSWWLNFQSPNLLEKALHITTREVPFVQGISNTFCCQVFFTCEKDVTWGKCGHQRCNLA